MPRFKFFVILMIVTTLFIYCGKQHKNPLKRVKIFSKVNRFITDKREAYSNRQMFNKVKKMLSELDSKYSKEGHSQELETKAFKADSLLNRYLFKKYYMKSYSDIEIDFMLGKIAFYKKDRQLVRYFENVIARLPSSSDKYKQAKSFLESAINQYKDFGIGFNFLRELATTYPEVTIAPGILYNSATEIIKPEIKALNETEQYYVREAVEFLEQIINQFPEYNKMDKVYFYLIKGYLDTKRVIEAKRYFENLKEKYPNSEYISVSDKMLYRIPKMKGYVYIGDFGHKLFSGKGEFGSLDRYYSPYWVGRNPIIDIEIDTQRNIFIADRWNKRVQKFDPSGKFLWSTKDIVLPLDIETDKDGYLYILEGQTAIEMLESFDRGYRITKISPEGERILSSANLNVPTGFTIQSNLLLMIESRFDKYWIKVFDKNLKPIEKLEYKTTSKPHPQPNKIASGEENILYVLDGKNLRKLKGDGEELWNMEVLISDIDYRDKVELEFNKKKDEVYLFIQSNSEKKESQLVKIDINGKILGTTNFLMKPFRYLGANHNGEIFIAKLDSSCVSIYDDNDSLIAFVNGSSSFKGQYLEPTRIESANDDGIFVYDKILKKKILYDKKGYFVNELSQDSETIFTKISYPDIKFKRLKKGTQPNDFAKGKDGKLYFLFSWAELETSSRTYHGIQIYDSNGNFLKDIILTAGEFGYKDIDVADDGLIYITNFFGTILVYNFNGKKIDEFGHGIFSAEPVDGYSGLIQIIVDSQKNVYAIDCGDHSIKKFILLR